MKYKNDLDISVLSEHLVLGDDNFIYWAKPRRGRTLGIPAGTIHPKGYRQIYLEIDGVSYRLYSHRVAYALRYGRWPDGQVDHVVVPEKDNNAPHNLRVATDSQNKCNKLKQANNKSGLKWVKPDRPGKRKNPWRAAVRKDGKVHERNGFKTKEEAYAWASSVAQQLHGVFYNPG